MSKKRIVHVLAVYDGETEDLTAVHRLEHFNETAFREQFAADKEIDPDLTERYSVGPDDVTVLRPMLKESLQFQFEIFGYFVEAVNDDT